MRKWLASVSVLLIGTLAACSTLRPAVQSARVWPAPPEQARVVYETTLTGQESLTTPRDSWARLFTGDQTEKPLSMVKPYDVAARGGLVVVSDTQARVVRVFDIPRRRFFAIGWRNEGVLTQPLGVAIDGQKRIYVADGAQNRVLVYDSLGLFLKAIGNAESFSRLCDVAVDESGERVYMLDRGGVDSDKHRLLIYDANNKELAVVGTRGGQSGTFNHPIQIDVSSQNEIYVLDAGNFRVQVFDLGGAFLREFGKPGNGLGQFARSRGLAVTSDGLVLVTDTAFQNFQIYTATGELLLPVGQGGDGAGPGEFLLPAGIAVDETGRIYVVDQLLRKIEVLRFLDSKNKAIQ